MQRNPEGDINNKYWLLHWVDYISGLLITCLALALATLYKCVSVYNSLQMINDYLQTNAWNMQCQIQTWFPDSNQLKNNMQMQLEEFKVNLDLRNNKKLYMPSNYSLFSTVALAVILSVSFTVHWLRRIMLDHISV